MIVLRPWTWFFAQVLLVLLGVFPAGAEAASATPSHVLINQQMPSRALGHALPVTLYVPADAALYPRLPLIILLHGVAGTGTDWVTRGQIQATADRLIATRRLPPVLIAMPSVGNSWYVDSAAIGGPGDYQTAIGTELPAWLAARWKGRADRAGRAIAGYSMGGFGALHIALRQPRNWVAAGAMSGTFLTLAAAQGRIPLDNKRIFNGAFGWPFDERRLLAASPMTLARSLGAEPRPAVFLSCGRQDFFHLTSEMAAMAMQLRSVGVPVVTVATEGSHDWNTWRASLPALLAFLGAHLDGAGGLIAAATPKEAARLRPASAAALAP